MEKSEAADEEKLLPGNYDRQEEEEAAAEGSAAVMTWIGFVKELRKLMKIAAPMVVVTVSQYLLEVVSLMMVGHISQLALSGAAMATSLCTVSGFSLLLGMAGALETLCGQAYGAEQYQRIGLYTYSAIISLLLLCIPISLLWMFMDKLLILTGQDPLIAAEAAKYACYLIPSLLAYAILQSLVRYFQTQSLILPMLVSSCTTLCFHVLICWALVYKFKFGSIGAALAISLSCWFNVILLGFYMKYSSTCEKTIAPISKDAFLYIGAFFRLGIPSAGMVCLEWWSFELLVLLSGLLPNPKLETSVLSICLTITSLHYFIPYGFGAAASTRIANELGAGNPLAARACVWAVMILSVIDSIMVCTILFCCRNVLGYAYSNDKEVVHYLTDMTPFICLSVGLDSFQAALSGVVRGSGWQDTGAYVNLGAFYLVGLPAAGLLGFILRFRAKGLWIGTEMGSVVQAAFLGTLISLTDWQKQATKTKERVLGGRFSPIVE